MVADPSGPPAPTHRPCERPAGAPGLTTRPPRAICREADHPPREDLHEPRGGCPKVFRSSSRATSQTVRRPRGGCPGATGRSPASHRLSTGRPQPLPRRCPTWRARSVSRRAVDGVWKTTRGRRSRRPGSVQELGAAVVDWVEPLGLPLQGHGGRHGLLLTAGSQRCGFERSQIDLDSFTRINDTPGHVTGDRVLLGCSRILAGSSAVRTASTGWWR